MTPETIGLIAIGLIIVAILITLAVRPPETAQSSSQKPVGTTARAKPHPSPESAAKPARPSYQQSLGRSYRADRGHSRDQRRAETDLLTNVIIAEALIDDEAESRRQEPVYQPRHTPEPAAAVKQPEDSDRSSGHSSGRSSFDSDSSGYDSSSGSSGSSSGSSGGYSSGSSSSSSDSSYSSSSSGSSYSSSSDF